MYVCHSEIRNTPKGRNGLPQPFTHLACRLGRCFCLAEVSAGHPHLRNDGGGGTDCRAPYGGLACRLGRCFCFAEVSARHPHRNDGGADYRFIAVLSAAKKISPHTFHHCAVIFLIFISLPSAKLFCFVKRGFYRVHNSAFKRGAFKRVYAGYCCAAGTAHRVSQL